MRTLQVDIRYTYIPLEGLFIEIDKPPMPRHETASAVDSTSLLDVFHDEVAKLV